MAADEIVDHIPIVGEIVNFLFPKDRQPNQELSVSERLGSMAENSALTGGISSATKAVENAPVIGAPLKFIIDFGNRTADSFFTGAQAEDDDDETTTFFDGWRQGWDSWGTEDHLTAGQLVGASLNNGMAPTGLSPFTPQGVKDTQTLARSTWYGDIAGATTDITAGFLVPGTGVLKTARAGKVIATGAEAQDVALAFNAGERAGKTGSLFRPASPQAQASRLEGIAKNLYDRASSYTDVVNTLGPLLSSTSGRGQRLLAEVAVTARSTYGATEAQHVIGNSLLANMGSEAARAELKTNYPLIASKLANGQLAPQVFADQARAAEMLHQQWLADPSKVDLHSIVATVQETPRKLAEEKALSEAVSRATEEAVVARGLRDRMVALRPSFRTKTADGWTDTSFDTARLRESRAKADTQFKDLQGRLEEARADAKADPSDAAAQQRVTDLKQRLGEARADRDLLNSTPLNDPMAMDAWRSEMTTARRDATVAARRSDMLNALHRTAKRELADDAKAAQEMFPGLSATKSWLADLDQLGRGDTVTPTLKLKPSYLDRMKTAWRDDVGHAYLYDSGEFNRKMIFHVMPKSWVANIGTAYGRSAVNVLDRYTGAQELGMYLKKSKVYEGSEIQALTEQFHRLQPGAPVVGWIDNLHKEMLDRLFEKHAPHLSPSERVDAVGGLMTGMGQSREYAARAADKAAGSRYAQLHEFPDDMGSDAIHNVETAFIRSQMAETVPFADPVMLAKSIKHFDTKGNVVRDMVRGSTHYLDMAITGWKLGQIFRPGIVVRNALDTDVRAFMIMGSVPLMMSGLQGTRNLLRNTGMRVGDWVTVRKAKAPVLQKIGAQDPSGVTRQMLNDVTLPNGQKVSLYGTTSEGAVDLVGMAQARTAMNKGTSPSKGILSMGDRHGAKFTNSSASWKLYGKADSKMWPKAYADYAKELLASPTARKVIESDLFDGVTPVSMQQVTREFFQDPAVRDEYARLSDFHEMSQSEFIGKVIEQTDLMFPEPGMANDLLAGKFHGASGEKWIQSHFPQDQRFQIPGEESIYHNEGAHAIREAINSAMNVLQDEPDFYLGRHPVGRHLFNKQVKIEAQALYDSRTSKYGQGAKFDEADLRKIEARARAHAIAGVRTYMYDASRQTGVSASAVLNRMVPFFAPFQDTMRAYSRLIYDDPGRLFKLAGLYNAPFNASMWTPEPFIVDENGEAIDRSMRDSKKDAFIIINGKWGTIPKTGERRVSGGLRLRASSFNTILQGDVPWLPGWGPAVQIPVQTYLGNDKELALKLSQSENPIASTLMESLFQDGEVPTSDANSLYRAAVPSWLRRLADSTDFAGTGGVAWGRNVSYLYNQKFMEAQAKGQPFDSNKAIAEAQSEARSGGLIQAIAQFGFGISGDAQPQAEFYVQRMHEFQALAVPPKDGGPSPLMQLYGTDDPAAVFAQQFEEADKLKWTFTKNETGINATATAQNAALKLKGIIDENPEYGWFILGGDNVGGDFSQTAYNQQKQNTYGATEKGRKQLSDGDMIQSVRIGQGWSEFEKWNAQLSHDAAAYGLSPQKQTRLRQAIVASIGQTNPDWYAEYDNRFNRVQDFYQRADLLAKDPRLADRQDIAMYATYRQAYQEVLQVAGLKSLSGTSRNTLAAKRVLFKIGADMAAQNIGFQQMWDRVLARDVEPPAGEVSINDGTAL